jgi:diguanylate cyclase (GGDEF)-like protein
VLNEQGNVTVESRTLFPRKANYAGRDYFQFHKDNASAGHYVGRAWVTKRGEYILPISRRLNKPDGSFQGVVVGNMKLSYFHRLLRTIKLGPQDSLTLIRSDSSVLMRSPFDIDVIGRSFGKSTLKNHILASQFGSFDAESKLDGAMRLFVYRQVGDDPMHIVAGLAQETIYADWWREVWVIGSLNLALCVIAMGLVVFLASALKRRTIAEHERAIMATTDGLTGICNRRRFDELFEVEWRRSHRAQTPIALVMIDADHFKIFNDKHGHQAGDAALMALATCIDGGAMRATDLAARYGGEEFAVLLPGETVEGALLVAEKIRATVLSMRARQQGRSDMSPTISVGVASMIPQVGSSLRDLIKSADVALYKAKQQGRNCCVAASAVQLARNENLAA